jgi:cytochrome c biogenesis factor
MRPVVLAQMPLGFVALALLSVPAVMTVMGALGTEAWRAVTRRWALVCWALLGGAMLLDWRRYYPVGAWIDDWRWAPVHAGTAFAWCGATLLVVASGARQRAATVTAGFAAFALGLHGLMLRRAAGWEGVHAFALSAPGRATGWAMLGGVIVSVAYGVLRMRRGAAHGVAGRAALSALLAVLLVAVALTAAGFPRASDVALSEGARATATDRFGTQWAISLEGVSAVGRGEIVGSLVALRATVNGRARAYVVPELRDSYAGSSGRPTEELAVAGTAPGLAQDLRVDVREANTTDALATVRFVPAASWIWIAGTLAILAALVMAFAPLPKGASGAASELASEAGSHPAAAPELAAATERRDA